MCSLFLFSSRRRHTRCALVTGFRRVLFRSRDAFDAARSGTVTPQARVAALTYDDTAVTRGRLADAAGVVMLKPLCRELPRHPFDRTSLVQGKQVSGRGELGGRRIIANKPPHTQD